MNSQLKLLHELCLKLDPNEIKVRLIALCDAFLGCKYGPWQDGTSLESIDDFKYELDKLDCVTYPEVVLALAKVKPVVDIDAFISNFEAILAKLHYANGITNFKSRNHFVCLDWIPNNKYMVEDITCALSSDTKIATALIDKANWMRHTKNFILENTPIVQASVPYIETDYLLEKYNNFITQFPEYCIVNIVRPNWDLTAKIGTHLNISHLGLAFKNSQSNDIDFYHSTSERMQVVKETLQIYMQRFKDSPTIRGINVLAISPGYANAW
jgi:hypothetical protein